MDARAGVGWVARSWAALLSAVAIASIPASVSLPRHHAAQAPAPVVAPHGRGQIDLLVRSAGPLAPISRARVRVFSEDGRRVSLAGEAFSDSLGKARVSALPSGAVWVVVDADSYARASTQRILVEGASIEMDLALGPAHTLSVTVKDDVGSPVKGAVVEAGGSSPVPVGARTNDEGQAELRTLGEPPWSLRVRALGYEAATLTAKEGDAPKVILRKLGAIAVRVLRDGDVPAAMARVQIAGTRLWPARAADTDTDGRVRIGALEAGSYVLRATSGSLVSPVELGVMIGRGDEKEVVLRLAPGRFVSARVMDGASDDAEPIRGARVTLNEGGLSPFPIEAASDKDGNVRLGPIEVGPASLSAMADGFVPSGAVPVPDSRVATIVLVQGGSLSGRVVDGRGQPVAGATLEVVGTSIAGDPIDDAPARRDFRSATFDATLAGPSPLIRSGELGVVPGPVPPIPHGEPSLLPAGYTTASGEPWVTREDGTFTLTAVSPGRIRLIARHPEFLDAVSDSTTLAENGTTTIDVVMRAGGSIEGEVVDAEGRTVAGAHVVLESLKGSFERTAGTADDGTFAFAAVPDEVLVTATLDDDSGRFARATVRVAESKESHVRLTLSAPRDPLAVHVADDRGYPVDAAQISAMSVDADVPLRTTVFTDAHGDASVPAAHGVALRLEVTASGHAEKVALLPQGAASASITLGPSGTVTGLVRTPRTGDPIEGAEVALYGGIDVHRTMTGKDGTFAFKDVAPGSLSVVVRARGRAPARRDVTLGPDLSRPADLGPIESDEEASVEGQVVDAQGDPVPGARVGQGAVPTFVPSQGRDPTLATTDARGRFRLGALAAGSVTLEAYAPDVGRGHSDPIDVSAGRVTQDVVIHLGEREKSNEPEAAGGVAVTLGETDGDPREVVVVSVADGSVAERAGLAAGDVLVSVAGRAVGSIEEARALLSGPLNEDVVLTRRRGDTTEALRVEREAVHK